MIKILIIDDEPSIVNLVSAYLKPEGYEVFTAADGPSGLKAAKAYKPDLIVLDLMLPGLDGIELLSQLRRESDTYVIMLTARAEETDKIIGLSIGADDYLTKPFDIRELQARIENLIKIRRKLQEKYQRLEYVFKPDGNKGTSLDEQFIIKVMDVIERHISEEEFSIEEFGNEVGMSRAQFHRKFKAITGKPASMFLRSVRLAKAKKMIEEQQGNISEIAYSVGFSSPSYFSKCFRDEFGYPPSNSVK